MQLVARPESLPAGQADWVADGPLWKRAPVRDEAGHTLSDFMMLAPGLKRRPQQEVEALIRAVQGVLGHFGDRIVFAEINLRLGTLWVSLRAQPGLMSLVVSALRTQAPAFKLVGHDPRC